MMLFKLSLNNVKKSIKDYAIYFLTLVLGVAIFYMFNSLDGQQAMIQVSNSQREIIKLLLELLNIVSVFVAIVLGLLIVYANRFLIDRRKKEFGIYMTLGMGKRQISKIILLETIFVGMISLGIGLIVGISTSQFMSIIVAKLFEADMSRFEFVFSNSACIKTCIYFAIMYLLVLLFNTVTVSKYKLINLLNATKKNEKIKMKNPFLCIVVFIVSCVMLGYAYWKVTGGFTSLNKATKLLIPIIMGIVGTILVFWSFSGFVLQMAQMCKKVYLKDANMFVLRQINNKINTTVISMSVICLMLFLTITILSSAVSLKNIMQKDIRDLTPVDINIHKTANLQDHSKYTKEQIQDSKVSIIETLKSNGFDMSLLKDTVEIPIYATKELTWKDSFGTYFDEVYKQYPMIVYDTAETILKVSDYNKIAYVYGMEQYELKENEYVILCDFNSMLEMRNNALRAGNKTININGKTYNSKYNECKDGYIYMLTSHVNTGIILVPDNCELKEEWKDSFFLIANYNATTNKQKEQIEEKITSDDSGLIKELSDKGLELETTTRISLIEASVGISTIVTFIAIYLGIIFLIASSAILALKQLTESSDNKHRYAILRKIGCDEKMINKALFRQIGIFFILPLGLAVVHSIFGAQFAMEMMSSLVSKQNLLPSIAISMIIISIIYGLYFWATYFESKNIIKEDV